MKFIKWNRTYINMENVAMVQDQSKAKPAPRLVLTLDSGVKITFPGDTKVRKQKNKDIVDWLAKNENSENVQTDASGDDDDDGS